MFTIKLKIMFIRTAYNGTKAKGQDFTDSPSLTVPDQSMSIREILSRYARGLSPSNSRTPVYEGDDDTPFDEYMPDLKHLDLAERQEILEAAQAEVDAIKEKWNKAQHQDLEAKKNTAIDKLVQERYAKYKKDQESKAQFRNSDSNPKPDA